MAGTLTAPMATRWHHCLIEASSCLWNTPFLTKLYIYIYFKYWKLRDIKQTDGKSNGLCPLLSCSSTLPSGAGLSLQTVQWYSELENSLLHPSGLREAFYFFLGQASSSSSLQFPSSCFSHPGAPPLTQAWGLLGSCKLPLLGYCFPGSI